MLRNSVVHEYHAKAVVRKPIAHLHDKSVPLVECVKGIQRALNNERGIHGIRDACFAGDLAYHERAI